MASSFDSLPTELWIKILQFVPLASYADTCCVCRIFLNILESKDYWNLHATKIICQGMSLKWNWLAQNATCGKTIHIKGNTPFDAAYKLYCGDVRYWKLPMFGKTEKRIVALPDGYGIMFRSPIFRDKFRIKYKGAWKNGQANGWGTYQPIHHPESVSGAWRDGKNPRCPGVSINYKPADNARCKFK